MSQSIANQALRRLDVLAGDWDMEAVIDGRPVGRARATFAWSPEGSFLQQSALAKAVDAALPPDWMAHSPFPVHTVIGADDFSDGFGMLYADGRGVCRVYRMTLADRQWNIWGQPAADFFQRFAGTFSDDGRVITGRWERSPDGASWELDFEVTYTRVSQVVDSTTPRAG
jgi:hypothetical protein